MSENVCFSTKPKPCYLLYNGFTINAISRLVEEKLHVISLLVLDRISNGRQTLS